ncbi:MAG: hypothetical protein AAF988_05370 [Pseudomonadota bacterium]
MTNFRDRYAVAPNGVPVLPDNLAQMVGASGPMSGAELHDSMRVLSEIMLQSAVLADDEARALISAGINREPTYNPDATLAVAATIEAAVNSNERPNEKFETEEKRDARKSRQAGLRLTS